MKSRIYIVDDHPVVREGLAQFINQEADLFVCGGASDIGTALREMGDCQPDVVITDLSFEARQQNLWRHRGSGNSPSV